MFSIVSYEDRALLQPPYDYRCRIVPLQTTNDNQQVIHLDCTSGQNCDVIKIMYITYIYAIYALFIKYFFYRDLLQAVLGDLCQLARYGIMYEKQWINYLGLTSGQDDDAIEIA